MLHAPKGGTTREDLEISVPTFLLAVPKGVGHNCEGDSTTQQSHVIHMSVRVCEFLAPLTIVGIIGRDSAIPMLHERYGQYRADENQWP